MLTCSIADARTPAHTHCKGVPITFIERVFISMPAYCQSPHGPRGHLQDRKRKRHASQCCRPQHRRGGYRRLRVHVHRRNCPYPRPRPRPPDLPNGIAHQKSTRPKPILNLYNHLHHQNLNLQCHKPASAATTLSSLIALHRQIYTYFRHPKASSPAPAA